MGGPGLATLGSGPMGPAGGGGNPEVLRGLGGAGGAEGPVPGRVRRPEGGTSPPGGIGFNPPASTPSELERSMTVVGSFFS
ncbi:MAG TPA: hypothetical protein VF881_03100, partial [Polyangiaceae bacterium]